LFGYWLAGLWTLAVTRFFLLSLPFIVLATLLGRTINQRMGAHQFLRYIHGGLIVIGIVLLIQAI
jgi:uncharacterized protein